MNKPLARLGLVVGLLTLPLLVGLAYFHAEDPAPDGGVFIESDRAYKITRLDSDRSLDPVPGYVPDRPGAVAAALNSPEPTPGRALTFYVAGPVGSPLLAAAPTATLWCFYVDGHDEGFRARATRLPATVTQINAQAYRVNSPELEQSWGAQLESFRQYERALKDSPQPREALHVLIGLELVGPDGARRMYSVRVGPPR